jgi:hypothetical protein
VRELLQGSLGSEEALLEVEREVPLLTIFVPTLPQDSFSARGWDTATQVPSVGITSHRTNDVHIVDGRGEDRLPPSDVTPGFPVVVVKENERVTTVDRAPQGLSLGRVVQRRESKPQTR